MSETLSTIQRRCSCAYPAAAEIQDLQQQLAAKERELAEAREVIAEIANQDYRGNRSAESQLAWNHINKTIGRREAGEVQGE